MAQGDIRITGGAIEEIGKGLAPRIREESIELRDYLALPGLINPHDHLDFNLLPIPGESTLLELDRLCSRHLPSKSIATARDAEHSHSGSTSLGWLQKPDFRRDKGLSSQSLSSRSWKRFSCARGQGSGLVAFSVLLSRSTK